MPYKHEYEYKEKLQEEEPSASVVKALIRISSYIRLCFELYAGDEARFADGLFYSPITPWYENTRNKKHFQMNIM